MPWYYAERDCPKCGSCNTWTNDDDFKCENCGRTTEHGGYSVPDESDTS